MFVISKQTFRNSIDVLQRHHSRLERLERSQRNYRVEPLQVSHGFLHLRQESRELLELGHAEEGEARAVLIEHVQLTLKTGYILFFVVLMLIFL